MIARRLWPTLLLAAVATAVWVAPIAGTPARGELAQRGNIRVSLDGGLLPRRLPRIRPAPAGVWLRSTLDTADGSLVPRVTSMSLGLPGAASIDARGLPYCPPRELRSATTGQALDRCRRALVGSGSLAAMVGLPGQKPFRVRARVLAFNARGSHRERLVLMHASATNPPTSSVVRFSLRQGKGRFGKRLVADVGRALGPWPHLVSFQLTIRRRYRSRGHARSYLTAACPIPKRFTSGSFSLARVDFGFADGRRLGVAIARSCSAR